MRLFGKYNRISILISILVFIAGCTAFYFILWYVLIRQLDGSLHTEQTEITAYVKNHDRLPEIMNAYNQEITFLPVKSMIEKPTYASEKVWNEQNKESEWRRKLVFGIEAGGHDYQVTVSKSQVETEDLIELVILVGAAMIALILLAGYVLNRLLIKNLWKPFYTTIEEVEKYHLAQPTPVQLTASGILEFDLLNQRLSQMMERAGRDFRLVKEFSINAAHEMQTPLAVIRSATETLMQDEQFLQQHNGSIQTIEQSVSRLNRLNQAMLLLTKIENGQFDLKEQVGIDQLVNQKIGELSELIEAEKINIKTCLQPVSIAFNRFLAEIIIQNLLNNAIRYNKGGGTIEINLEHGQLMISNTSTLPELDIEKITRRFYRHPETQPEGNGLGLSIVKEICDLSNCQMQYAYRDKQHVFSINFQNGSWKSPIQ